jgi:hypothetical protein
MDSPVDLFIWAQHHASTGAIVQLSLMVVVCALTWMDPLVRGDRTTAAIGVAGWVFMALIGSWRAALVDNPSGVLAWGVACLYLLVIVATVGRPLLIMSDLLEEKEEDDERFRVPSGLWRRSRAAQFVVIAGILFATFALYYL